MTFWFMLVAVTVLCYRGEGYNLEERLPLYKIHDEGGAFGFSVALHKTSAQEQASGSLQNSLLVIGSPTAPALTTQTDTRNPGAVFSCPVSTNPQDCIRIQMDEDLNAVQYVIGGSTAENNKTDQWLGVSLKSQGNGKYLITCAHRHSERGGFDKEEKERVCGKCFLLNNRGSNELYEITPDESNGAFVPSPCDGKPFSSDNKNTLGYTQAGVSVSWLGDEYLLGGPGAYAWSGAVFDFKMLETNPDDFGFGGPAVERYETHGCLKSERGRPKCAEIPLRRDSYIGFSVATSNSLNNAGSKDTVYVAGAPRGNFTGAVVMYEKQVDGANPYLIPRPYDIVMGDQIGSSFGFSVAVTDINGDGLDDLLVGAPQYYEYSNKGKHGGAAYIYLNTPLRRFGLIKPTILLGKLDSFFGYSIAPLGDIDQDGFNDFAVGAPYEQNGKVYIYRGSADGIVKQSQVFDGSDYVRFRPEMTGFGVALSGDVDIDNNKYPDLTIGSLSDQVVLFRSRPIITVESTFEASALVLDLKAPNCLLNGKKYSCFTVEYCFTYSSRHKEYSEELAINYTVTLDAKRQRVNRRARTLFHTPKGDPVISENIRIPQADLRFCPGGTHTIYIGKNINDRLRPIFIDFEFSLVSDGNDVTPEAVGDPVFQMIYDPILNADYPHERSLEISLLNDCGDDGCQSNLQVGGSAPELIVVGGSGKITLKLNVSNDGEEAHQASVSVKLPNNIYYDSFTVTHSSGATIACKPGNQGGSTFVTCSLGNPYYSGSKDEINIDLDVSKLTAASKKVVFEVTGSTTSKNPDLPPLPLYSNVIIEMELLLTAYGHPQQVRYSNALIRGESGISYTDEIGPMINHTFIIRNDGQQVSGGIVLNVQFPYEIKNGKWLLYLVSSRVMAGGQRVAGLCSQENINMLGYKLPSARTSRKKKREVQEAESLYKPERVAAVYSASVHRSTLRLNCEDKSATCYSIECTVDPIQPGSTVSVFFQSRLWNATFLEEFREVDLVDVEVLGELANVDENVRISGKQLSAQIRTTVDHTFFQDDISSVFPWWYIVIGVVIVFILYAIVIFLLIRCGFFKRKRYPARKTEDTVALVEERRINEEEKL